MESTVPSFPEEREWTDVKLLDRLTDVRGPVDGLNRQIVGHALRTFLKPLDSDASCVEIGAGDGKLRTWLTDQVRPQVLHTEPSATYARQFREHHPEARFQTASVYELPFEDHSLTAVLGLCVLDALERPQVACDEIGRVLRSGGCLLHFLDLGLACLSEVFKQQLAANRLPLPNFLSDASLMPAHANGQARVSDLDLLDDIAVCDRSRFQDIVQYLSSAGHPLSTPLTDYLQKISEPSRQALQFFMWLTGDPMRRSQFIEQLTDVRRLTAGYPNLAFNVEPVASINLFSQRMEELFSTSNGFRVDCSQIFMARAWRDPWDDLPTGFRHFARVVGQVVARRAPDSLKIGTSIAAPGEPAHESQVLVESGMHVLVVSAF